MIRNIIFELTMMNLSVDPTIHVFWLSHQRCSFVVSVVARRSWVGDVVIKGMKVFHSPYLFHDVVLLNSNYTSNKSFQFCFVMDISGNVAFNLPLTKFNIRLWQTRMLAALMTMPETTIDENDGLVFRQNNIRIPWYFFT